MNSGRSKSSLAFRALLLGALALAAFFPRQADAVITASINYQGFLLSKITNLPVDTPQDLKFVIYDSPAAGTARFTESRCNVRVSKGRYDVEIGSVTPGGLGTLFVDYPALWLEIQVDGDGDCSGAYEPMTPRVRLQASPYAFNSLYASTASAATPVFSADVIAALPQTTFGAVTISTNLFVQGGISVGSISPGQKLAVAGVVESTGNYPACAAPGNYTCGFKFPDGSVQVKAAALTMWDILGLNLYTINEGNTSIGGGITNPLARLHISSAPGSGDLLLISTGPTPAAQAQLFRVNADGQVYGGSFYGDGTTLTGLVRSAGDTMSGQLTMAATSSFTVISPQGAALPRLRLAPNVEISSAPASVRGGVMISSHVYLMPGATFYGDGSGLYNITTQDHTKVLKTGDTMTGQLTLYNSTLTVTGGAFGVTGSTFSVFGGSVAIGGFTYPARLSVTGGINATANIASQGNISATGIMSANSVSATLGVTAYSLTASSGTFIYWDPGTGYSVDTASGIKVRAGVVDAPYFIGNGSLLSGVIGTDSTRVLKAGDRMTGSLLISGSSLTVADDGSHLYALTVASAASVNNYSLAVTTGGSVGVQINDPAAPLEVKRKVLISNAGGGSAELHLNSDNQYSYIRWSDSSLVTNGSNQGVLGYPLISRDLVYRVMGSDPENGGQEVFRIKSDDSANWRFGIGTNAPTERFHVEGNVLVTKDPANPVFFVSTTTRRVGIRTVSPTHALTVNGGIFAASSVTAQGLIVSSVTGVAGSTFDGVVFSTTIYASSKLSVGLDGNIPAPFDPLATLHVRGTTRLDQQTSEDVSLEFYPNFAGNSYIRWYDGILGAKGVLGIAAADRDLVYRGGATTLSNGSQIFRIKSTGEFIIGGVDATYAPFAPFHVLTNMSVNAPGQSPALFISTGSGGSVGISTGTPRERAHVGSSFLVGGDRASAVLFVSTQNGYTGVGTGSPAAKLDVNGLGVFRSSLTVTGTGLTGTQTALAVIGSTLIVRNDGTVGIGTATPAERLEVAGKVQATGFVASREVVTATCNAASTCPVSCTAGKSVMGGGCSYAAGTDFMTGSFPASATSWQCDYSGTTGNITVYAICSTVQ